VSAAVSSPARRAAAVLALVAYLATFLALLVVLRDDVLALVGAMLGVIVAVVGGWYTVTGRGARRLVGTILAVVGLGVAVGVLVAQSAVREIVVVPLLLVAATFLARRGLSIDLGTLRAATPPGERVPAGARPVLLMNPKSGGGKVERFDLVAEAGRRGIEAVVLGPDDDLETLARAVVARGADVIGMAGGDGSQALVAGIASEHDLSFVCIPAGTRNHFALDLGVDRDDVVGALDAYVDGYERRVDLARCAGRVFVNNVSLGIYAKVVQSDAYRDDKLGTVASMLPDLLGPDAEPFDLRFTGATGNEHDHADLILVSNNRYQLERIGGFGTRARMDEGVLGIVTIEVANAGEVASLVALQAAGEISRFRGWRDWTAPTFEVRSSEPIAAGVDGEALVFDSPLRFEIVPGCLRVRVAPSHPGYSPAATAPVLGRGAVKRLVRVALGHEAGGADTGGTGE
jgi:diacylglycerol kinase family enzyme